MRPRHAAGAFVIAALAATGARGQQPSFRATTEVIVVDVSVVGRDGAPVRGLQEPDFTVKIDGQPRAVRSLKYVDETVAPDVPAAPGARRISSNASEGTGRLVLIVVDEGSIAFGGLRAAAESVDRLLAGFGPADKIGLATLPTSQMLVDFTRERARIAEAMKRIPAGSGPRTLPGGANVSVAEAFGIERGDTSVRSAVAARECSGLSGFSLQTCSLDVDMEAHRQVVDERNRTAQFVSGMRGLLSALVAVDAPKLIIVFSEGFPDPEAVSQLAACGPLATSARATIFAMRLDRSMFDLAARRAAPFSIASLDERSWSIAALDALSGAARGTALEIAGSADLPFARLARELSGYYLLGVEADARDRDGKFHPITVSVARPNVTVRARRELTARAAVQDEKKLLAQTLASPLAVADIPLRVTTFNMADDDPARVRVLVVAEVDREPPGDPPATAALVFTDEKGKSSGDILQRVALTPTPSGALSLMLAAALAPGDYTMKLALARAGRAGSVEHRLAARLTTSADGAAPLQMGDLLVAEVEASDRMASSLHGRIAGDRFVSFVQVGPGASGPKGPSFVFDVAREPEGPALLSAVGTIAANPKGKTRVAEAVVDARLLPPGDYGVRLNVTASGRRVASLFTPFSLDRSRRAAPAPAPPVSPRGRAARPAPAAASGGSSRFAAADVLDPLVVAPFLEEVARLSPASSRPALELARSGRMEEAVRALEPGRPGDPSLSFLRGLLLFGRGELQPASNEFRAAIAESQELFVGAFYIGACYAAGGKDAQAVGAWQTSLVGLGRYPAVYRFLGDALIRTGQAERAQKLLATAASRWPDDEALRSRVMRATVEAGRYQQALDYADQIIEAHPADSSVLFLAMRSAFQALMEGADVSPAVVLARLTKYRDLYVAAGGLQQALVEEWVRYAEKVGRQ